jgi:hypothetical protein
VINGTKAFITNSGTDITGLVTVTAVTGTKPDGRKEISSIIVPSGTPGFTVAPQYSKVGWNCSDTHELAFDDVRVPAVNLLGERGRGYAQFLRILDEGRIAISALATGLAQGCVDECVRYSGEREAFGRKIGGYQAVAFKIADMEMRAHVARTAYHDAGARMLAGEPFKHEAAIAKLFSSEIAVTNAREATQVFGGYGFMNEYAVARMWRDAKILEIGEGTSEVQRMLIARQLGTTSSGTTACAPASTRSSVPSGIGVDAPAASTKNVSAITVRIAATDAVTGGLRTDGSSPLRALIHPGQRLIARNATPAATACEGAVPVTGSGNAATASVATPPTASSPRAGIRSARRDVAVTTWQTPVTTSAAVMSVRTGDPSAASAEIVPCAESNPPG